LALIVLGLFDLTNIQVFDRASTLILLTVLPKQPAKQVVQCSLLGQTLVQEARSQMVEYSIVGGSASAIAIVGVVP
jgi:hypothetical protein